MIKVILPALNKANIIMLVINHINQKINTGFMPTQAQINYLSQDESISGKSLLSPDQKLLNCWDNSNERISIEAA